MFKKFGIIFLILSGLTLASAREFTSPQLKLPKKKYHQEQKSNVNRVNTPTRFLQRRKPVKRKSQQKYRPKIDEFSEFYTRPLQRKRPIEKRTHLEHRLNFDWLNGVYLRTPSDSTYNPTNAIFQTEDSGARTDLNIDYRLSYDSIYKLVIRPRVYHQYKEVNIETVPSQSRHLNKTVFDLTEVFAEAWLGDKVSVTVGLQNYQWGPAEFLSPSDPLYHFNSSQWSLLWRQKGQNLVRLNLTPTARSSFVGIFEPIHNDGTTFIAQRNFVPKYLLKAELRGSREAQNYFGLTGGSEEEQRNFVGAYLNFKISDGWSIYTDIRSTQKPFIYSPQLSGSDYNMLQSPTGNSEWSQLGVFGIRYEEGSWDLRVESIYNSSGYSKTDLTHALTSIQPDNPNYLINGQRFLASGLELYGKFYSYISLRIPDIGDRRQWQFSIRYMYSGMDSSGTLGGSAEWAWTNHLVAVSEVRESIGQKDNEFLLQEKHYAFLGLKTLW